MSKQYRKKECLSCHKKFNRLYKTKGETLCWSCSRKKLKSMQIRILSGGFGLDRALSKVYTIRPFIAKKSDSLFGQLSFPRVLVGKKVKLVLVEDGNRKDNKKD